MDDTTAIQAKKAELAAALRQYLIADELAHTLATTAAKQGVDLDLLLAWIKAEEKGSFLDKISAELIALQKTAQANKHT